MSTSPAPLFDAQAELAKAFAGARPRTEDLTSHERALRASAASGGYAVQDIERNLHREVTGDRTLRGRSAGERVINSDQYQMDRARGRCDGLSLPVLSGRELAAGGLRTRTNIDVTTGAGLLPEVGRDVRVQPVPVRVPQMIDTIVVDGLHVHRAQTTTFSGTASAASEGASLPALTDLQGVDEDLYLRRFGCYVQISRGHYLDSELFRRTVDTVVVREWWRGLESMIVSGSGVDPVSPGILTTVAATPRGTDTQVDAILKRAETIRNSGFYGPLVAALHPLDLGMIRRQKASTGAYLSPESADPDIRWITCSGLAQGTAVVGDFNAGGLLWLHSDGLQLDVSQANGGDFIAGNVVVRAQGYLAYRTRQPAAFGAVTGL